MLRPVLLIFFMGLVFFGFHLRHSPPNISALDHNVIETVIETQYHDFTLTEVAGGLEHPWGMAFLPNGDLLVTEREGQLRLITKDSGLQENAIRGLPPVIFVAGQGGLLDVAVHPSFKDNGLIYLSYATGDRGSASTEVARGVFDPQRLLLKRPEAIFTVEPQTPGTLHYGSRLLFDRQGLLYITTGDRYNHMKEAQSPANHLGSILRVEDDGLAPTDNPFIGQQDVQPETFTYGHRNVQGIALRPSDGSIWAHEHGPKGGDELNKLRAGANYGWPAITYGVDYSGAIISDKTHMDGMEQPVIHWTPSIAPSGMAFYDGDAFPKWSGDLFVGALAKTHLRRVRLDGDTVIEQEVMLDGYGRIRDVEVGPDGFLYILIDALDGKVIRLEPAQ